jgi:hypothetical protein
LIPGFINVEIKASIKAASAIAVFVFVFFFSPVSNTDKVVPDTAKPTTKEDIASAVVEALVKQLKDESASVRWAAANSLADLGHEARTAVPFLMDRVADDLWVHEGWSKDNSPGNTSKDAAIKALAKIEPDRPEIVMEALLRAMKSSNPTVKQWATEQVVFHRSEE